MFNPTEADERKNLNQIIDKLEEAYINVDENVNRQHKDLQEHNIKIRFKTIHGAYLHQRYNANSQLPLMRRHTVIAADVINKAKRDFKYTLKKEEKKEIRKQDCIGI